MVAQDSLVVSGVHNHLSYSQSVSCILLTFEGNQDKTIAMG